MEVQPIDVEYWNLAFALAKHDPYQKDYQTTIEACYFPTMELSLQESIDQTDMSLPEIIDDVHTLIHSIPYDDFHELRKAFFNGIIHTAHALDNNPSPVNTVLEEVYGLPSISYTDDSTILKINKQINEKIPTHIPGSTITERYQNFMDYFRAKNLLEDEKLAMAIVQEMYDTAKNLALRAFGTEFIPNDKNLEFVISTIKNYGGRFIFKPEKSLFETVLKVGDLEKGTGTLQTLAWLFDVDFHEVFPGHYTHMTRHLKFAEENNLGMLYGFVASSPYGAIVE